MQVVALVESPCARTRVRVEVNRRARDADCARLVVKLQPARATCRDEGLEPRRGAREVVRE